MTLITFTSAKGSPGTTTTSQLMAALWPRACLLVDADTRGGDIAIRTPDEKGLPLGPDRGLMSLMPQARRGVENITVGPHVQRMTGGVEVLTGLTEPEQADAVASLWPALTHLLRGVEARDVLADVGSVSSTSPHLALVRDAEALVFVLRPRATDVLHTRYRIQSLQRALRGRGPALGVIVIAPERESPEAEAAFGALGHEVTKSVRYLGHLALDPAAAMFEGRTVPRPERTAFAVSGSAIVSQLAALVGVAAAPPTTPSRRSWRRRSGRSASASGAPGPVAAPRPATPGPPRAVPETPPAPPGPPVPDRQPAPTAAREREVSATGEPLIDHRPGAAPGAAISWSPQPAEGGEDAAAPARDEARQRAVDELPASLRRRRHRADAEAETGVPVLPVAAPAIEGVEGRAW